jgi:hypothetical protein
MLPFKEKKYQILICFHCSNKMGPLSLYNLNKNSCFMCGQFIFNNSTKNAYLCLKHQEFMPKCALCKNMIANVNNGLMGPTEAKLCSVCIEFKCCSVDN